METLIIAVVFAGAGTAAGWFLACSRNRSLNQLGVVAVNERLAQATSRVAELAIERDNLGREASELRQRVAVLETQYEHERERLQELQANDQRMAAEFDRLSRATLKDAGEQLVKAAEGTFKVAQETAKGELNQQRFQIEHLVKPVQDNLTKLEQFIQASEKERKEEFGGLFLQLKAVAETNSKVQEQAAQLKNVLRSSTSTRGRWGEVQLRRVVELAGMCEHSDFSEQESVSGHDGRFRADLVVYLPGNVKIAVDAKVPYGAYEQAHQSGDDAVAQKQLFLEHAKQFRAHVDALAKKAYWDQYLPSCGFTVLFVPGEALLDTALLHDQNLWQNAAEKNILLATPSTLIALLRMASLGWRQESQAQNAAQIATLGKELYKRLTKATGDIEKVGKSLKGAVVSYNDFVGSLEGRVLPQARKLADLSTGDGSLKELEEINEAPRRLRSRELADEMREPAELTVVELLAHAETG